MGKLQGSILKNDKERNDGEGTKANKRERKMGGCVGCWGKETKIILIGNVLQSLMKLNNNNKIIIKEIK